MAHRRQKRRGVLLLVSLVLLVLFLMLGVTFVLMAGNFRRSSEAYRRLQESGNTAANAENLLHGVARDLVRGTSNPESPFSKENLLEDMYGQPALRGSISAVAPDMGGQFTKLTITADADFPNFATQPDGYYSGLVLTMVTGTAVGQSTRIVDSSSNTLTVMTGGKINATDLLSGDLVLVNGRPFSGDGRGHATNDPKRLNEDYDAPDGNNPWLTGLAAYISSGSASGEDTHLQAAWGRPDFKWGSGEAASNPQYNRPRNSIVEVDNDGDGEPESIWIDAGLPLQERADGRLVKPLVAMLVRDLDGRVNLNAHGSRTATALEADHTFNSGDDLNGDGNIDASDQPILPLGQGYGPAEIDPQYVLPTTTATDILDARHAPDSVPGAAGEDALSAVSQFHHYGLVGDAAISRNSFVTPHDIVGSGLVAHNANGQLCYDKMGGQTAFTDDPYEMQLDTAFDAPNSDTPFTPAELEAVFRAGDADAAELPRRLHDLLQQGVATNDPAMQSNQLRTARAAITTESWDLPVHPHALPEELNSHVAGLPDPLKALLEAPVHITDLFKTRIHQMDPEYPPGSGANLSTETDPDDLQTALNVLISALGSDAISPEMLRGLKFNVNRLFGNGQDDDGDGVVDNPGEAVSEEAYGASVRSSLPAAVQGQFTDVDFDHNGDGTIDAKDKQARQQYAKQLYLLLMLVSDMRESGTDGLQNDGAGSPNAVVPAPTGNTLPDGQDRRRLLARRLAQFAANAVDYRDADSIMTGFEYDANPFDGWDADGDLSTNESNDGVDNDGDGSTDETDGSEDPGTDPDRGVVWGLEAPVALLTETLALHDRRVRDVDETAPGPPVSGVTTNTTQAADSLQTAANLKGILEANYPTPPLPPDGPLPTADEDDLYAANGVLYEDNDFDQVARPEGSLFLEIYCTANPNRTTNSGAYAGPQDLYDSNGQLELSKTNASGDPVWRVAISAPHPTGPNLPSTPDDETQAAGPQSPVFNQLADIDLSGTVEGTESPDSWNPLITMQPETFQVPGTTSGGGDPQIEIQRLVYFADKNAIGGHLTAVRTAQRARTKPNNSGVKIDDSWDGIYCNVGGNAVTIAPGGYAVVGPRQQTPLGRTPGSEDPSLEQITLSPGGGVETTNNGGVPEVQNPNAVAVICEAALAANPPGWSADPQIGLSVSEPLGGSFHEDYYAYHDPDPDSTRPTGYYHYAVDDPFDQGKDWFRASIKTKQSLLNSGTPSPVLQGLDPMAHGQNQSYSMNPPLAAYFQPGTVEQYCTAFLQRLANPLRPWNPMPGEPGNNSAAEPNPYLTVDAMPIDLTVFNGDDTSLDPVDLHAVQAKDLPDLENLLGQEIITPVQKAARERGDAQDLYAPVAGPLATFMGGAAYDATLGVPKYPLPRANSPLPHWADRPFVSGYELLMVPASEPGKLTCELGAHSGNPQTDFHEGFPHLLNFFYEDGGSNEPRLGRLFDYLHVPSRYAGTQTTLRPDTFQTNTAGFSPPFNQVSQYREPGRVNLNTIYEPSVWEAILHGVPAPSTDPTFDPRVHPGPPWISDPTSGLAGLPEARGGTDTTPTTVTAPFRAATAGTLNTSAMAPVPPPGLRRDATSDKLLFADVSETVSPYFRYQSINRLGNLVTTRSNVYAVWMTLGFFEIQTNGSGNVTGATEIGSDTGEQERHRAYYMIDRTIPVGYENGQDHNTEDVFRMQRFIE